MAFSISWIRSLLDGRALAASAEANARHACTERSELHLAVEERLEAIAARHQTQPATLAS